MEATIFKEQGNRLYMIANNVIVELDLSSYQHGIIGCNVGDVRTCLILPNEHAKNIKRSKFDKYFKQFQQFLYNANKDTGRKSELTGSTPAVAGELKGYNSTTYLCSICRTTAVDVNNGYDTCSSCASNI